MIDVRKGIQLQKRNQKWNADDEAPNPLDKQYIQMYSVTNCDILLILCQQGKQMWNDDDDTFKYVCMHASRPYYLDNIINLVKVHG